MNVSRLRMIIITLSFFVLIYGGLYALYFGDFLPTFACYFVGSSKAGTCFLYPLQAELETVNTERYLALLKNFIIFSALIIVLGRAWCGWICPMGFLMDLMDYIREKMKISYIRFPEKLRNSLRPVKWIFLAIALIIPFWVAFPEIAPHVARDLRAPFCSLCPAKYILPVLSGDFLRTGVDYFSATSLTLSLIGLTFSTLTIIGAFFKKRFFCAYCPMGLVLGLYRKISFLKLKKDIQKCTRCEICYNVCPMEIETVYKEREKTDVTHVDCNLCLKCVECCPEDGALAAAFCGKKFFTSSRKGFLKKTGEFTLK